MLTILSFYLTGHLIIFYMKSYFIYLLVTLTLLSFLTISCSRKSKPTVQLAPMNIAFKVSKGRSPKRPLYTMAISDKEVLYNGKANMDVLGERSYTLTEAQYATVYQAFLDSNFQNFEESYIGKMRDLPIFTLTYNGRSIRYQKREAPEGLLELAEHIIELFPKKD